MASCSAQYICGRRCLLAILSCFYTPNVITDPKYKFSPSGTYYAPSKGAYEDYVEFIKVWSASIFLSRYV